MRILVVEDDFISRRLLCRYLEPFGECDVAPDGRAALRCVRRAIANSRHYDLICLDIMMPEMDGQETLREVRNIETDQGLTPGEGARVIMTTALEDHANVMKAFRGQCDGYVVKPIEKKKLVQTLKDIGLPMESAPSR
jgi:two-component system chemotaxis response regulator CheY